MNGRPTTAALTTAPARGGIAVIVLSGPETQAILRRVFRPRRDWPEAGRLSLGWIVRADDSEQVIDEAVVTLSETGPGGARRALAEINIHGGPQAARTVLALLARCGAQVVAGQALDLPLAEAAEGANAAIVREMLAVLPQATTPLAAAAVTAQAPSGLTALAVETLAALDATGRTEDAHDRARGQGCRALAAKLLGAADGWRRLCRLLAPAEVVIAGPPNAGKSALANALVGRDVSLVADVPGTTRDWVRHLIEIEGVPIWLTDTAGLWEPIPGVSGRAEAVVPTAAKRDQTRVAVDVEAVRRAWARIETADLVLCLSAGDAPECRPLVARLRARPNVLDLAGKCDILPRDPRADLAVSAVTLTGIPELRRAIRARLGLADFDPYAPAAFTQRQARLLQAAAGALEGGNVLACRQTLLALLGRL